MLWVTSENTHLDWTGPGWYAEVRFFDGAYCFIRVPGIGPANQSKLPKILRDWDSKTAVHYRRKPRNCHKPVLVPVSVALSS